MTTGRSIARLIAPVVLGGCLMIGSGMPAHACSCPMVPPTERVADADAVFVGRVGAQVDGLQYTRTVDVHSVYKGRVPSLVTVSSGQEETGGVVNSCNYTLPAGGELVFFAHGAGATYDVGACSRPVQPDQEVLDEIETVTGEPSGAHTSRPHAEDQQVAAVAPEPKPSGPGRWVLPGLGLIGLATVAVAVIRRGRRAA